MRRRDLIAGIGSAAAWPLAARTQQAASVRRIGMAASGTESDQAGQAAIAAFREGLAKLGWTEGRNLRIDMRFGGDDAERRSLVATCGAGATAGDTDDRFGHCRRA